MSITSPTIRCVFQCVLGPVSGQLVPVPRRVAHGDGYTFSSKQPSRHAGAVAAVFRMRDHESAFPSTGFHELDHPREIQGAAWLDRQAQRNHVLGGNAHRDQTLTRVIARIEFPGDLRTDANNLPGYALPVQIRDIFIRR